MITKHKTLLSGEEMQINIHNRNSLGVRIERFVVRGIPYSVHLHYTVKDMILTEDYRFISRTDVYDKDATHKQKDVVSAIIKNEVFDYIFCFPELLEDAQVTDAKEKWAGLKEDREKLYKQAEEITAKMRALVADNPLAFNK